MLDQAALVQELKGKSGIIELRKHLPWYLAGSPGASKLREKIVRINTLTELKKVLK
jgi:tRNA-dihydrouridine synthase